MKNLKSLVIGIAFAGAAAVAATGTVSADHAGPPSFSPDGVNWIPMPGHDGEKKQVLSYLNGGNFTPDGASNLQDRGRQAIAMFSPDGINQVPVVEGPKVVRKQVLAYLNGGNFSPDGASNLQDRGRQVIAMFSPDGVNQVPVVEGPRVVRKQVLAYLNGGNFSPDGASNLQDRGRVRSSIEDLAYLYMEQSDAAYVG